MIKNSLIIICLFLPTLVPAQQVKIIKFNQLQDLLDTKADKIYVINFWATWCAPCVKELPLFEKLQAEHDLAVKVTLVNLDYADKIDRVNAFVRRKELKSDVVLLDEIDYNTWIDKVDKNWSGAIPATLIINMQTGKRKFLEKELQEGELENVILALQKDL